MKILIWLVIVILVVAIFLTTGFTIYYAVLFNDCNNSVSPYCPQYTCPNGNPAISYSQCASTGACAQGLTSPCSIQATKNNTAS